MTDGYTGCILFRLHTSVFPLPNSTCFLRDLVLAFLETILDRVRRSHKCLEYHIR